MDLPTANSNSGSAFSSACSSRSSDLISEFNTCDFLTNVAASRTATATLFHLPLPGRPPAPRCRSIAIARIISRRWCRSF